MENDIQSAIRALPADGQRDIAVRLAEVALPFGSLVALSSRPLKTIADSLRAEKDPAEIDLLRRVLWDTPALHEREEPSVLPDWYALGAVAVWVYAADSLCTAPCDGAVNTYTRLIDLLDEAEGDFGSPGLCDKADRAVRDALADDATGLQRLTREVEGFADEIRRRG